MIKKKTILSLTGVSALALSMGISASAHEEDFIVEGVEIIQSSYMINAENGEVLNEAGEVIGTMELDDLDGADFDDKLDQIIKESM